MCAWIDYPLEKHLSFTLHPMKAPKRHKPARIEVITLLESGLCYRVTASHYASRKVRSRALFAEL